MHHPYNNSTHIITCLRPGFETEAGKPKFHLDFLPLKTMYTCIRWPNSQTWTNKWILVAHVCMTGSNIWSTWHINHVTLLTTDESCAEWPPIFWYYITTPSSWYTPFKVCLISKRTYIDAWICKKVTISFRTSAMHVSSSQACLE